VRAEGFQVSQDVTLRETPGHTPQDISTLAASGAGTVAFTHLWWSSEGPDDDPVAVDFDALRENRERVLALAVEVVPGHGPKVPTRGYWRSSSAGPKRRWEPRGRERTRDLQGVARATHRAMSAQRPVLSAGISGDLHEHEPRW
jgi:glyoxylase-like metal-dependent hydrolase (beta-lactamase superfamily II)